MALAAGSVFRCRRHIFDHDKISRGRLGSNANARSGFMSNSSRTASRHNVQISAAAADDRTGRRRLQIFVRETYPQPVVIPRHVSVSKTQYLAIDPG